MAAEQKQQVAVIGAVAYDQISTTPSALSDRVEPLLNCKLSSLQEAFGGCGGNIAYNLVGLGSDPVLATCSGVADDHRYLNHCEALGIDTRGFLRAADHYCARAIIITDVDGRQFTGFFPGPVPTPSAWTKHLHTVDFSASPVFVQAPYPPELMQASLEHAGTLPHKPLKIWCPGQYADQLDSNQIATLVERCDWIVGNAYEIEHLQKAVDTVPTKLVIKTNGGQPVEVAYADRSSDTFDVVPNLNGRDPTGCGDAFLAAVAHHAAGEAKNTPRQILPAAIAAGNRAASTCLASSGGQQHEVSNP